MTKETHDRGAFGGLEFKRCARGFILIGGAHGGGYGTVYAFDKIEDLAAWLVDQYGERPDNTNTALNIRSDESAWPLQEKKL